MKKPEQENFVIKKKRGIRDYSRNDLFRFVLQVVGFMLILFVGAGFSGFLPEEINIFNSENRAKTVSEEVSSSVIGSSQKVDGAAYSASIAPLSGTLPQVIRIPKVGIETNIEIPASQEITVLNQSLEKGAVYYPESGSIAEGNMFIFGHSSNWKIVQNRAYKTFNGIEDLVAGDEIILESEGKDYIYEVATVSLVNDDEALVEIGGTGRKLTLSTCNSFGEKQERWVVEAYPKV